MRWLARELTSDVMAMVQSRGHCYCHLVFVIAAGAAGCLNGLALAVYVCMYRQLYFGIYGVRVELDVVVTAAAVFGRRID